MPFSVSFFGGGFGTLLKWATEKTHRGKNHIKKTKTRQNNTKTGTTFILSSQVWRTWCWFFSCSLPLPTPQALVDISAGPGVSLGELSGPRGPRAPGWSTGVFFLFFFLFCHANVAKGRGAASGQAADLKVVAMQRTREPEKGVKPGMSTESTTSLGNWFLVLSLPAKRPFAGGLCPSRLETGSRTKKNQTQVGTTSVYRSEVLPGPSRAALIRGVGNNPWVPILPPSLVCINWSQGRSHETGGVSILGEEHVMTCLFLWKTPICLRILLIFPCWFQRGPITTRHTVNGRNPAPPKKPWNEYSPVNTNKQWLAMDSQWRGMDSATIHRIFHFFVGGECQETEGLPIGPIGRSRVAAGRRSVGQVGMTACTACPANTESVPPAAGLQDCRCGPAKKNERGAALGSFFSTRGG